MGDAPSQLPDANLRVNSDGSPLRSFMNVGVQRPQPNMAYDGYGQSQYAAGANNINPMDMRSLATALPTMPRNQYSQSFQQYPGGQSAMYQYPPGAQFAGQTGATNFSMNPVPQSYQNFPQTRSNYAGLPISTHSFQSPGHQIPQGMVQNMQQYAPSQQNLHPSLPYSAYPIRGGQAIRSRGSPGDYNNTLQQMPRSSSAGSGHATSTSALRGPPRKPRQSGHALWVGNLPPGTNIVDLKDYFSRDATDDIESVFLISKSNCAFVNYKSEASCDAAMKRFHETRFQGVRLVCRLRRGGSASSPAPQQIETHTASQVQPSESSQPEERVKEKYFVVKSLTLEDLERSVQSGVWATQAHNEEALSKAYESADDVFLIFSANKSGEYFGYAKMSSAIGDEEAAAKPEILPKLSTSENPTPSPNPVDLPLAIITPPTATAPQGRIIDDSSRGTIFWEVITPATSSSPEKNDNPVDGAIATSTPTNADETIPSTDPATSLSPPQLSTETSQESTSTGTGFPHSDPASSTNSPTPQPQSFGKPFKITWLSTDRLPFFRTRGLRNPWNANREVKIARDGTEIEPSVGKRLVGMFGREFLDTPQQAMQSGQAMGLGFMGAAAMGRGGGVMMPGQQQQGMYAAGHQMGQQGYPQQQQQQPHLGGSSAGGGFANSGGGYQGFSGGGY